MYRFDTDHEWDAKSFWAGVSVTVFVVVAMVVLIFSTASRNPAHATEFQRPQVHRMSNAICYVSAQGISCVRR